MKVFLVGVFVLALFAAGYAEYVRPQKLLIKKYGDVSFGTPDPAIDTSITTEPFTEPAEYALVDVIIDTPISRIVQQLVAKRGLAQTVIVPDMGAAVPDSFADIYFGVLAYPRDSGKMYFFASAGEIEEGVRAIYAFDLASKSFSLPLAANKHIDPHPVYEKIVSPNKERLLSAHSSDHLNDFRTLYVVDLVAGSERVLVTLGEGETFAKDYRSPSGNPNTAVTWIDDKTVEYTVFRDVSPLGSDIENAPLRIERTTLGI